MKRKSIHKRKSKTRKYIMYGGVAPAPAPGFTGFGYTSAELHTSLKNYLDAAYSIKVAANAVRDTSINQNNPAEGEEKGSRFLQRASSDSFNSAAGTMKNSLDRLYMAFTQQLISLPPTPGIPPHSLPPYTYSPPPM